MSNHGNNPEGPLRSRVKGNLAGATNFDSFGGDVSGKSPVIRGHILANEKETSADDACHKEEFSLGIKPETSSLITQEWLTTEEAARYLGLSVGSLRNMASNGNVPYYKLGRRNRYRISDLKELLLSQKRGGSYVY